MLTATSQGEFYRGFLMARGSFKPQDYGIDMPKAAFVDLLVDAFNQHYHGDLTVDELLLRPRSALHFCEHVRHKHGFHDLPDDIILRTILSRRKNPGGC